MNISKQLITCQLKVKVNLAYSCRQLGAPSTVCCMKRYPLYGSCSEAESDNNVIKQTNHGRFHNETASLVACTLHKLLL